MPYTINLRIAHLDQNIAQPEIPENTAKDIIDSLLSNVYVLNAITDADITITHTDDPTQATDWQSFMIDITDTGVVLTTTRNIILPDNQRAYIFRNSTAQSLTFKTSLGAGVTITAGGNAYCFCDGTNIEKLEFAASGAGTTLESLSDTPTGYGTSGQILVTNGANAYSLTTTLTSFTLATPTITTAGLSGTTTFTGPVTLTSQTVTGGTLTGQTVKNYGETSFAAGTTGAVTLDLSNGNVVTCTPTGAITFTFTTTHTNTSFTMYVTNFGAYTHTWPAAVVWEGGTEPTWTAIGNDLITFTKIGTVWVGGALTGVA